MNVHFSLCYSLLMLVKLCTTFSDVYTYAGMQAGSRHINESMKKLPQELVIPNSEIHLLESIGQGEI